MILILTILSSSLFIFYGLLCLFTKAMQKEFIRYGLSQFRLLTGFLELLGGSGLLIGYFYSDNIYLISSGGLTLLMLLGSGVRIKIKDSLLQTLPALSLFLINAFLFYFKIKN